MRRCRRGWALLTLTLGLIVAAYIMASMISLYAAVTRDRFAQVTAREIADIARSLDVYTMEDFMYNPGHNLHDPAFAQDYVTSDLSTDSWRSAIDPVYTYNAGGSGGSGGVQAIQLYPGIELMLYVARHASLPTLVGVIKIGYTDSNADPVFVRLVQRYVEENAVESTIAGLTAEDLFVTAVGVAIDDDTGLGRVLHNEFAIYAHSFSGISSDYVVRRLYLNPRYNTMDQLDIGTAVASQNVQCSGTTGCRTQQVRAQRLTTSGLATIEGNVDTATLELGNFNLTIREAATFRGTLSSGILADGTPIAPFTATFGGNMNAREIFVDNSEDINVSDEVALRTSNAQARLVVEGDAISNGSVTVTSQAIAENYTTSGNLSVTGTVFRGNLMQPPNGGSMTLNVGGNTTVNGGALVDGDVEFKTDFEARDNLYVLGDLSVGGICIGC